ncbi:MAG: hypothetical protein AAF617_12960 [Bacteroidota bacterium]
MKKISFLVLFAVLVSVHVNAQSEWKIISLDSFSIKCPSDWTTDTSKSMGVDVFMYKEADAVDGFAENINVLVQDLSGYDMDLDSYTELSEGQIKDMIIDGKILSSSRVTNGAFPYHKIIYVGQQNELSLQFLQRYYIKDKKAYVLTLTCEKKEFKKYLTVGNTIFKSFRFN